VSQRAVQFDSGGSALKGVLHEGGNGPGFVCVHGLTLSHEMFADLGALAEVAGISVLRFHLRGHHDSGGKLEEQGFLDQVADVAAAVEFMKAQPGLDPARVGLLGFSLGGAAACVASPRLGLKALATWASLFDTKRWQDERYSQYRGPLDGVIRIWDNIAVSVRLFKEAIGCDPFQDALNFPGPYFAAHGGRDRNHPQAKSIELVEARKKMGRPAEGYFPPASGHKFQVAEDWKLLNQKTLDFFKESL
jgi:dipeptidyl aminopeptidase/acylaminoacyl peptidase